MTHLDISSNNLTRGKWINALGDNDRNDGSNYETNMAGVIALANAIPDMGAMTSLDLAGNNLDAEGAKIVAEAIKVTKFTSAIVLVPFSCPSDFSINCCCLLSSAGYEGDDEIRH